MTDLLIGILGFLSAGSVVWVVLLILSEKSLLSIPGSKKLTSAPVEFGPEQIILFIIVITALVVVVFDDLFWGMLLLFLGIGFWYFRKKGPKLIADHQNGKILIRMRDLFPQALGMFIQALKTGQTVPQVLDYLSNELPNPLKQEFSSVCVEMNLGLSAEVALGKMAERFPDFSEFHQFLESYKISRQTGANLTHLLQVLLDGMEEKNRILRKMNAMTSQARLSGLVMGLLPFLLGLIFFVMDPNMMMPLVTTKGGWGILLAAAVLESIGFLWIRQLLRLEV